MAAEKYIKLSGRSTFSVQEAYLGEDHLLVLDGVYQENAKRIDYADVEAILVCPTKSGSIVSLLAGLGGLLFTIVAMANVQNSSFIAWLIVAVVIWVIFGLGIYSRGSAIFGIQTAVQTVLVGGLGNRRKAYRAKRLLTERIEAVQGRLSAEALHEAQQAARSAAWEARGRPKPQAGSSGPPPIQRDGGVAVPKLPTGGEA